MRILILSANTGGGHNSTANALREQLEKMQIEYQIADTLAYISERVSNFISKGHIYLYRNLPKLFGWGYHYEENHSTAFMYEKCAKGAAMLQKELTDGRFDAVICTHLFGALMMTEVRKKYGVTVPCYFISTDYTCYPGVSDLKIDGIFVPHRMLLGEFVRNGISADHLFPTGIPVGSHFYEREDRLAAKKRLGLPEDKKVVMLSCGSMGCGHMEKSALLLLKNMPQDACLTVLCGSNRKSYEELQPHVSDRLFAVEYTKEMWHYMSAADLYITKPGGLTSTEAIVKQVPMIFINAVPGCETRNYDFLIGQGVASGAKHWKQVIASVNTALQKPELLEERREAMRAFVPYVAAEMICRRVVSSIQ